MEQIDFHFGVANRSLYACRLIKKVQGMGLLLPSGAAIPFF